MVADAAARRVRRRRARAAQSGGITQLLDRHPRPSMRAVTRAADDADGGARPQRHRPRRRLPVRPRRRRPRRTRRRRPRAASTTRPPLLAAIDHDDTTAARRGAGRHRLGAVRPGRPPANWSCRRSSSRKTADGATAGSTDHRRRRRATLPGAAPAERRRRRRYAIEPVTPSSTTSPPSPRPATRCAAARLDKAVIAREIAVDRRPADRPPRRAAAAEGVVRVELPLLRRRASSARRPSCSSRSTAHVVRSHPLAGTAPRTGDVDADARIAAELIASTKNQVEHRVVIDVVHDTLLPWCSYLDWEPEPSIVTVANVQHLGTRDRGPAVGAAARTCSSWSRALSPDARRSAATRGHDALALIADGRGRRAGPLRRGGRLGRRRRQRHVGRGDPLRRAVADRPPGPPRGRRRHRRRQRSAGRARRDAGQVPGDARPPSSAPDIPIRVFPAIGVLPAGGPRSKPSESETRGAGRAAARAVRWVEGGGDGGVERGVDVDVVGPVGGDAGDRRVRPRRAGRPSSTAVVTVVASRPWARRGRRRRCRAACRTAARTARAGASPPAGGTRRSRRRRCRRRRSAGRRPASASAVARRRRGRRRCRRRAATVGCAARAPRRAPSTRRRRSRWRRGWRGPAADRAAEPLEVADRHRRGDDQLGAGGELRGDGRGRRPAR